jgi:SagB-type dehydrogenase family enzyme
MVFVSFDKEVEIRNCNYELSKILPLCSGMDTEEEIINQIKNIKREKARKIISVLFDNDLVVDGCKFYNIFNKISQNPMHFFRSIKSSEISLLFKEARKKKYRKAGVTAKFSVKDTALTEIIKRRKSIRDFDKQGTVSFEDLSGLVWATLGSFSNDSSGKSYTIPSGGSLYPTNQYLVILKDNDRMKKGIYYCEKNSNEFIMKTSVISQNKLYKAFDSMIVKDASFIQVLTSEIGRIADKYSNRGYRYALLEAGHAAQNSYLFCAENNLAVVEYGGFQDKETANLLDINFSEEIPLICMIIGKKKTN